MSRIAVTSPRVATEASEILRKRYAKKPKSVAGSALAQAPEHEGGGALQRMANAKKKTLIVFRSGGK
jgi:hypothetical protein